jgi:hypothetical protein
MAFRAWLPFLRMRNDTESRNDDPDDRQAGDRHSSSPLGQVRPVRRVDRTKLIKGTLQAIVADDL